MCKWNLGKKMFGVLAAVMVFSVSTVNASAMCHKGGHHGRQTCINYVDADGNGICDNCGSLRANCYGYAGCTNYVDADGNGICDNCGSLRANCHGYAGCINYVDADGNGICDNCGSLRGNCHGYAGCTN